MLVLRLRFRLGVNRRCGGSVTKRCDRSHTDRSNPTRAGPYPYGNLRSNSPTGEVRSQRRSAMGGDEGARRR